MSVRDPRTHTRFVTKVRDFIADVIVERRKRGLDLRDEVWNGEYHMSPYAGTPHQLIFTELLLFLHQVAVAHRLGQVLGPLNLREPGSGKSNYRVPDIVFVSKRRAKILSDFGCEGGADLVIEIRSEDDESYEKLPFYAEQGVREVLVIDAKTKRSQLFRASRGKMVEAPPLENGALLVRTISVTLRLTRRRGKPALELRDTRDPARSTLI